MLMVVAYSLSLTLSISVGHQQCRKQKSAESGQTALLTAKKFAKNGEREGKNQQKIGKVGQIEKKSGKRNKLGRKHKMMKGFSLYFAHPDRWLTMSMFLQSHLVLR